MGQSCQPLDTSSVQVRLRVCRVSRQAELGHRCLRSPFLNPILFQSIYGSDTVSLLDEADYTNLK